MPYLRFLHCWLTAFLLITPFITSSPKILVVHASLCIVIMLSWLLFDGCVLTKHEKIADEQSLSMGEMSGLSENEIWVLMFVLTLASICQLKCIRERFF